MEHYLGYAKHDRSGAGSGNSRNGFTSKTLKGDHGEVDIAVPRDRNSAFEPIIIGKRQTRLTQFDDQILSLYAKGMSTRDIVMAFEEMYGANVRKQFESNIRQISNIKSNIRHPFLNNSNIKQYQYQAISQAISDTSNTSNIRHPFF